MRAGAGRLWGNVKNVERLAQRQEASGRGRHSARVRTFRKNKFELLESCAKVEHFEHLKYLIKNGVSVWRSSLVKN